MRAARVTRLVALALLALMEPGTRAASQDFTCATLPGPATSAGAFIESGLPPVCAGSALDASYTRWFGLPELETRAVACGAGWRLARVAAGFSQTGEPDLGWSALGLACGVARPEGGAGLRAVARRDRAVEPGSAAAARLEARAGAEVGWGAWLQAARGLRLWAAVPQSWTRRRGAAARPAARDRRGVRARWPHALAHARGAVRRRGGRPRRGGGAALGIAGRLGVGARPAAARRFRTRGVGAPALRRGRGREPSRAGRDGAALARARRGRRRDAGRAPRPRLRGAVALFARALAAAALAALLFAAAARAQLAPDSTGYAEPPPEEPEGADYEVESADSLAEGAIELGMGASGRAGARPRQTRRVRFNDRTLGGSVREGEGDPLAGGSIETGALAGRVGVGRLAPRWGRGLLLGAAAEPWSAAASDRGAGAPFRGRAGRGAWYRLGEGGALETLYGRFAKRDLAGGRARAGPFGFGALADRAGHAQASLSFCRGRAEHELALDRAGRWRAEAALERSAGPLTLAARVRGGLAGLRSLAEPLRSGPARALAMELRDDAPVGPRPRAGRALALRPGPRRRARGA